MDKFKTSKMGDSRIVILPTTKYTHGDKVVVKPKGLDIRLYLNVSKSGEKLMAIIPKKHWEFFRHRGEVYVRKWQTKR